MHRWMGQCTRADEGDEAERARRLEALFDAHSGRVFAYAARRSSPQDADDVVGETFLVAWRRLDAFLPTPSPGSSAWRARLSRTAGEGCCASIGSRPSSRRGC